MLIVRRLRCAPGFTLVELLTVIAIIAVLSSLTFGLVRGSKQRASLAPVSYTHLTLPTNREV